MDKPNLQARVRTVMVRVLEDAAFIFSDEGAASSIPADWNAVGAVITFSGERSGEFRLWADPALCRLLASNMLGIESDDEKIESKSGDALRETVNIIAGNLLTELFGTQAIYDLGLPKPADPALREPDRHRDDAVVLEAEGNRILGVVEVTQ